MMNRQAFILILFLSLFAGKVAGQICTIEAGSGSTDQTICNGDAVIPVMVSFAGATSVESFTFTPGGLNVSFDLPSETVTISGNPSGSGSYSVTLWDGAASLCTTSGTITVTPDANAGTVVQGTTPQCIGSTTTYTVAGEVLGGGTGGWTSSNTAVATVNSLTGLVTAAGAGSCDIIYTVTGGCGGTQTASQPYTVTPNASAGTITAGTTPQCIGETTTFTVAGEVLGGGTGAWTSDDTSIATVDPVSGLVTAIGAGTCNIIYTVTGGCNGTPSASQSYTVNPSTEAPIFIAGATERCESAETITYTATAVNSTSITYSRSPVNSGTINPSTGVMTWDNHYDGIATITATAFGLCGTMATNQYVTVYASEPNRPGSITGLATVCQGQSAVSYTAAITANTTYYQWTVPAGATIVSGQGTSNIIVDFSAGATNMSITVQSGNACGLSSNRNLSITVRPTPTATISGTTTVCQGAASPNITFSNPQSLPVTITYNINGSDQTTVNVNAGSSANVAVPTATTGTFTYILVSVAYQSGASCPNGLTGTASVTVTPTVGIPTPITVSAGSDPTCQLTNGTTTTTYSTTAANSTGFNWSLSNPAAGSINSSSGVMTWANGFSGSVNIQVSATGCGTSSQVIRTVNITPAVGTPTVITVSAGSDPTCQLANGTTTTSYSTTATNSTGFNWSLSNNAAGSINPATGIMTWANGFSGSVNIQVTASGCGTSSMVTRTVNVTPNVGIPTPITVSAGSDPTCQLTNGTTTTTYSTTATNNIGFTWSLSTPAAGSIDPVTGVMSWNDGFSGNVNIEVYATGCNGNSSQVIRSVSITPAVGTPTAITLAGGSEPNCQLTGGTTMAFYSTTATNSTGFNWSLSNGAAGTINTSTGFMTWNNGFSGTVDIRVTASGCGTSPQITRTITVNPLPVVTISGPAEPRVSSSANVYQTELGMSGYIWTISGGGTGTSTTDALTINWNTIGNQTVSVNYIDTKGCTAVNPTIFNVSVKPLVVVSDAAISGYPAIGIPLTGTYTYTDGSNGIDNSTFRWLRDGTDPVPFATASTYVPTIDDVNKSLTFEVTPVSSAGPPYSGAIIKSLPTDLVEDLTGSPEADEVCITGIRAAGNTIRGDYRYTFSKAEGVSTYRWLRKDIASGTSVVISTNRQYTLVGADIDDSKEILFEVTPVSSNLTPIVGTPAQSNPLARILIPKTEYSISEADVVLAANVPGGVFSGTGVSGNVFSPSTAGASVTPYTITYLLNIVNTISSCSQQASKLVTVNPNNAYFDGIDPVYCHDGGQDIITVAGFPSGSSIIGFTLTNPAGIISQTGNSVTIDPGNMEPGINVDVLDFSYNYNGVFYKISQALVIDKVGTEMRILNLDNAFCKDDPKKYITIEGVSPPGGTGIWTGDILSDTKVASAYAEAELGTAGQTYLITYQYRSSLGCYGALLSQDVVINAMPDPTFILNPTYNIDGPAVPLVPAQSGGAFSGNGVSGSTLFPNIAGLGESEITYSITDANSCFKKLGIKTLIRKAQGTFEDIPSIICYSDTTYNVKINGLPMTGLVTITSFTNTKNTLIYTPGAIVADYNVPAAGAGIDTLKFSYKWDGVDYRITYPIIVDSLGQVSIKELSPGMTFCNNAQLKDLALNPTILNGVFTGPVIGGYLDVTGKLGDTIVAYKYTNPLTGCFTETIVPITINPAPIVSFLPKDVCIVDDTSRIYFINNTSSIDPVSSWEWTFKEASNTYNSSSRDTAILFRSGGLHRVVLTATTVNICSAFKDSTIDIGIKPKANFYWLNDCMHDNDEIILRDTSVFSSAIATRSWSIDGGSVFSTDKNTSYLKSDTGYLKIKYVVRTDYKNCEDSITRDVYIRPSITVPADGYFQDFETGKSGWVKGDTAVNSWMFGTPDRAIINRAASGSNAWFTGYDVLSPRVENSSIVSPCFDFSAIERPMINVSLWRRFEKESDGAALQYKIGDEKNWHYVGTLNDGINWFNSAVIKGRPGGDQLGWTTIGTPDPGWIGAYHTLDILKGASDVKFRIAYGSEGRFSDHDGIAFDDIWIGERSRNVLVEHFANLSSAESKRATEIVTALAMKKKDDVINIQYHTNFPGSDPFYDDNPGDASARILFYGLTKAPYTFIDGGTRRDPLTNQSNFANIFDWGLVDLDTNDVTRRSLIAPRFDIEVDATVFGGVLTISGKITALDNISSDNLTLFLAVTEKENHDAVAGNGETVFYNVFRKFIPDAGGLGLKNTWTKGESLSISEQSWLIDKISNSADIEVIAFLQNSSTKELYQAVSEIEPNIVVGIESLFGGKGTDFALYPNPTAGKVTIAFEEPLTKDTDIRIYDGRGIIVKSYKAGSGLSEYTIENPGLRGGIYLVRVTSGGIDYGFRKLIVSGD